MSNSVTDQIHALIALFENEFMKPQILTKLTVSQIENEFGECRFAEQGDENLEADESLTATYENACLCRLSASGYMDCTDWELCHNENDILEWISREAETLSEETENE